MSRTRQQLLDRIANLKQSIASHTELFLAGETHRDFGIRDMRLELVRTIRELEKYYGR